MNPCCRPVGHSVSRHRSRRAADRPRRHQVVRPRLSRRAAARLALYPAPARASPSCGPATSAPFEPAKVDDLLLYITAGVVLGGRLGFVLFYEPSYYLANPQDIIAVWKGGMAFHGALVGCGVADLDLCARATASARGAPMDLCTAAVPIGLFFGRIANFINGELFGRPTDHALGHGVSRGGAALPRRRADAAPSEPALRGGARRSRAVSRAAPADAPLRRPEAPRPRHAAPSSSATRWRARSSELFREPHFAHAFNVGPLTAGIVYSIPMLLLGLCRRLPGAHAADLK